ncbi:hypothetical protein FNAPI_5128 [Fusarium napiforme]|uniref:C2H2-type domain-containing protein n=1 Tax=Fusarium napiforme TaxID=42672 RepID=A0A8H5JNY9_9HYPO|nr:hypothetical protein FNAPI_5128 [Fusarium napiforme]
MATNESSGPVIQDKRSDNRRASQYNEISCLTDSIRDMQGHGEQVAAPQRDYFEMTSVMSAAFLQDQGELTILGHTKGFENPKAAPSSFRIGFRDERRPGFRRPSSPIANNLHGQRKGGLNATSLPKSEIWEQASEEEGLQDPLLLDDEISVKSFNLKRQADDIIGPGKRSRTSMTTDTNKRLETFACPFYRKNPERFLDCISLKMPRIADVKQHLKRRHTPNHSCTRCHEGFSSSKAYEEHILSQSCPITDCNNNDNVSPPAQQALKDRLNRGSSPERQWHDVYMILFGKPEIPLNPYKDDVFKEVTGIIRGIWKNEGQNIVSSLGETRNVPCADQLRPLWSEILTRVEIFFEQKGKKPSRGKPQERRKVTKEPPRGSSDERKVEHNATSLGVQGPKSNNGELEINGPYSLPMEDWQFPAEFGPSDYLFNCPMPLAYQTEQADDPHDDVSTSLPSHDERGNWPSMGMTSTGEVENIMLDQNGLFIH